MKSKTKARPFLKWVGGKSQLLPEISKRMPSNYYRYFEPFVGGGAVFFSLQKQGACLVDINHELINTYRVVRDRVDELVSDLKRHVYDKTYYYNIRNVDRGPEYATWNEVQKASRFIYLNKTCYNSLWRVNSRQEFNTPIGRYSSPTILDEANLRACSEVLQNGVELMVGDFRSIEKIITLRDFVYFDPPYIPLTKTASFISYSKGGFGEDMQRELCDLCHRLNERGVRFMLSNSSASLVLELYKPFKIELVQARRAVNSRGDRRGKIPEAIVTNY